VKNMLRTISRHKWRYLAITAGFLLFVHPFAYLIKAANLFQLNTAEATLHNACLRMSIDWIASGNFTNFVTRPFMIFLVGGTLVTSFFFGPLFCGWLCPVGSSTEVLSRQVPKKGKIDLSHKLSPTAIRYGFFASFVAVSLLIAFTPASAQLGSICCRYCASTQLQNVVDGISNPSTLKYWNSAGIMTAGAWLFIGGVFWKGGRGWCLYACPLGAASNVFHAIGSRLPFTYKLRHTSAKCSDCDRCKDACPMWAISDNAPKEKAVNRNTCIACMECVKACPTGSLSYARDHV
jgi:ferredoxin-type protein NapH